MLKFKWAISILIVCFSSQVAASESHYLQGPQKHTPSTSLAGTVITSRLLYGESCYGFLADRDEQMKGLGGGGRFFICGEKKALQLGEFRSYKNAIQVGTTQMKVGPRMRVYPVFKSR